MDIYSPEEEDEIPLGCGEIVEVLVKSMDGWWMVKDKNNQTGLAPATYLKKMKTTEISSALVRKPQNTTQSC